MDIHTGVGVRRANPKSFQLVVNKKGKKSILFQGELFYRRYVLQGGYHVYQCRAFAPSFVKRNKNEPCRMKLTVDLNGMSVECEDGQHTQHACTYNRNDFEWNEYRNDVCELVRNNNTDRSQQTIFNDWRRGHIATGFRSIPVYKSVKSSLARARRSQNMQLPTDATDLKLDEMGLQGNWYSRQDDPKLLKFSRRNHWQLEEDRRIHCWHSGAQNAICKEANHVFIDGTFSGTPRIKGGVQPWAQVFSLMVGHGSSCAKTQASIVPNKKTESYFICFKWFLMQLEVTDNRLATNTRIDAHSDLEKAIRNACQVLFKLFLYELARFVNDMFHLNQLKYKYVQHFGLQGAYSFTNKGDPNYLNKFRLVFEFVMCLELLSVSGVRKLRMVLKGIMITSIDSLYFDKMRSSKTSVKKGVILWWKWYTGNFGDGCPYSFEETNSFDQDDKTNNIMESMHTKMSNKTGAHPPLDKWIKCIGELESDYVNDYLSRMNQNKPPTRSTKEQIIHDRTHMVWDVIKAKETAAKATKANIDVSFYMARLVELHDIYYEYQKYGRSRIDWDNHKF